MSAKTARQNKIKEILQTTAVSSQEVLVDLLHGEGIDVTQTTLSRDFAELGIVRVHTDSGTRYVINIAESGLRTVKLLAYEILHIAHNESAVVIRTLPGRANGVAHFIDRMDKPEILGTIAGDDTVMIIPDSHANIPRVLAHIRRLTEESE